MQQPGSTELATTLSMVAAVTDIAKNLSIVGLLIFILIGGKFKWWVFGWVYEAEAKRCQDYENLLFQALGVTERAVDGLKESANLPWRRGHP